jgi:hypothetical protein
VVNLNQSLIVARHDDSTEPGSSVHHPLVRLLGILERKPFDLTFDPLYPGEENDLLGVLGRTRRLARTLSRLAMRGRTDRYNN